MPASMPVAKASDRVGMLTPWAMMPGAPEFFAALSKRIFGRVTSAVALTSIRPLLTTVSVRSLVPVAIPVAVAIPVRLSFFLVPLSAPFPFPPCSSAVRVTPAVAATLPLTVIRSSPRPVSIARAVASSDFRPVTRSVSLTVSPMPTTMTSLVPRL